MKKVLSVKDTGTLIKAGEELTDSPQKLYAYFCGALDRALEETAKTLEETANQKELAKIALDLALRSYANQLACARILDILQPDGENSEKKSKSKKQ